MLQETPCADGMTAGKTGALLSPKGEGFDSPGRSLRSPGSPGKRDPLAPTGNAVNDFCSAKALSLRDRKAELQKQCLLKSRRRVANARMKFIEEFNRTDALGNMLD